MSKKIGFFGGDFERKNLAIASHAANPKEDENINYLTSAQHTNLTNLFSFSIEKSLSALIYLFCIN